MLDGTDASDGLPVAIIGAGPVGLAAAAHLALREVPFVVVEAGKEPGAAIRDWAHVTFFSPWRFNVDSAAGVLLARHGWALAPGDRDRDPTGGELIERYLAPLAAVPELAPHIRYGLQAIAVTRHGMDRVPSAGRDERPFEITFRDTRGREGRLLARAVIDASGTWRNPNPAGSNGRPASGEHELARRIRHGIPDVSGAERERYAGRRVMVIGAGHSAMDSLIALARLQRSAPATQIIWGLRSPLTAKVFGGGREDQLSSRGALGVRAKAAIEEARAKVLAPFRVSAFAMAGEALSVAGDTSDGQHWETVDEVIVATGFRPDFSGLSEIRLDLHPWLECPRALGPLIDPNEHSCGDVPPHGVKELAHPENDFFIVGMKSYGRAPTFLMMTGYEQVRSIAAALAGDWVAAHETRLVLPQTGVCEGLGHAKTEAAAIAGCCGGPSETRADACCVKDAEAKDRGEAGCGCSTGIKMAEPESAKPSDSCTAASPIAAT
mgnify:CR=1 FL=1